MLPLGKISYDAICTFGVTHNGTSNEGATKKNTPEKIPVGGFS